MSQKTLSITLKFIDAIMVACCCGMAFYVMPQLFAPGANAGAPLGDVVAAAIVSAGPVAIGILAWLIFVNIGKNESFCVQNAKHLQVISVIAVAEAFVFLVSFALLAQESTLPFETKIGRAHV